MWFEGDLLRLVHVSEEFKDRSTLGIVLEYCLYSYLAAVLICLLFSMADLYHNNQVSLYPRGVWENLQYITAPRESVFLHPEVC